MYNYKISKYKKITIDELEKYNDDKLIFDEYDFQIYLED